MNTEEAGKANYSRLNDARAELRNRGFEAVRDAEGAWNIVMCAMPGDRHHSICPELIGLPVGTGWQNEGEALDFALSHVWELSSRQDALEKLHREFESAACRAEQVENGWRVVSSTCADDRVFSTRTDLLVNTQQFVRDEKERLAQKRLADAGLPEELCGLVTSKSEQEMAALLRQFMEKPDQGWVALCGLHAKTIACSALAAAATEIDHRARMGTYVSAWDAIQDRESFAEVLSTSKFIVLDMTTLIPAGTKQELGERIAYLMQPSIDALLRMRPAQAPAVIVSSFSVETLKRLLGKQLLARYSTYLRFVDSDGNGFTKNPFLKSYF